MTDPTHSTHPPSNVKKKMPTRRHASLKKRIGSSVFNNNISKHEVSIAYFAHCAAEQYDTMNSRLEEFRTHEKQTGSSHSDHFYEWIRERRSLNTKAITLSRSLKQLTTGIHIVSLSCTSAFGPCNQENLETVQNIPLLIQDTETNSTNYRKEISKLLQCLKDSYADLVENTLVTQGEGRVTQKNCYSNGQVLTCDSIPSPLAARHALFAELLLSFRESLSSEGNVLDMKYRELSTEIKDNLRMVLYNESHASINKQHQNGALLPDALQDAVEELKNFCNSTSMTSGHNDEMLNIMEIDALIVELKAEFDGVKKSFDNSFNDSVTGLRWRDLNDDNWNESCQIVLTKSMKEWKKAASRGGKKLNELLDRIAAQTNIPVESCKIRWYWMEDIDIRRRKERTALDARNRRNDDLTKKGLEKIKRLKYIITERLSIETKDRISQALMAEQRERLANFKQAKNKAVEIRQEEIKLLSARQELERRNIEAKNKEERLRIKGVLKDYLVKKEKIMDGEIEKERKRSQKERQAQVLRLTTNEERCVLESPLEFVTSAPFLIYQLIIPFCVCFYRRVQFRRKEWENKMKRHEKLASIESLAQTERLEKLSALAATVPYYSAIINTRSDIHKSTIARMNDIYELPSSGGDLADFQQGLKKLRTFTNDTFFSDTKFRLAHALHEAGVANTAYSHAIVKQLIPRVTERTTGI